mmetsp:Transcript_33749/g.80717  ORF Transcript_33749/g.80717 Transcript_33749/m.80717 type:complete len:662 (+) Transcript_33749:244-2229(+)
MVRGGGCRSRRRPCAAAAVAALAARSSAFAPPRVPAGPPPSFPGPGRKCRNIDRLVPRTATPPGPTALRAVPGGHDGSDDNPALSLIRSWLTSKLPSLHPSEVDAYATSLLNDGYSAVDELDGLNSGASGRVEDLYFMRKDHRQMLMRELGGGLRGRSRNAGIDGGGTEDGRKGGDGAGRPTEFGSTEVDGEFALFEEFLRPDSSPKDDGGGRPAPTLGGDRRAPADGGGPVIAVPVLLDGDSLDAARARLDALIGSDAGGDTNEGKVDGVRVDEEEVVSVSAADVEPSMEAEATAEEASEEGRAPREEAGAGRPRPEGASTESREGTSSDHPGPGDGRSLTKKSSARDKKREAVSLSTDERCARPVMSFEAAASSRGAVPTDHRCPGDERGPRDSPAASDRSPLTTREGTSASRPSVPSGRSAELRRVLLRDGGPGRPAGKSARGAGQGVPSSLSGDERCERPAAPSSRSSSLVRVLIDGRRGKPSNGGDGKARWEKGRTPAVSMSSAAAAGPTARERPDYDGASRGLPRDGEVRVRPTPAAAAADAGDPSRNAAGTPSGSRTRAASSPPKQGRRPSLVVREARTRPVPSGRTPGRTSVADRTGDAPRAGTGAGLLGALGGPDGGGAGRRGRASSPKPAPCDRARRADSALARLCLRAHS